MMNCFRTVLLLMVGLLVLASNPALAGSKVNKKVKYEPLDSIARLQADFPYEAEFKFKKLPMVGDSATMLLKFKAKRDIPDTIRFSVNAMSSEYLELGMDSIVWPSPRKGKSFETVIPLRFLSGGNYRIMFEQAMKQGRYHNLYRLAISFGVDGEVIYFGKHPTPVSNCLGHFYTRNSDHIRILKKNRFDKLRLRLGIPFNIDIRISPVPHLNDTSTVDFVITTNSNFIHDIQFQWIHSPSIKMLNIPESWSGRPRTGDSYRGSFDIVPRLPGYSIIDFQIFGKDMYSKLTGKSKLEIPFSMIFDTTGALIYFGEDNIYDCNFDEDDPIADQFYPAYKFDSKLPLSRMIRSQPDFEKIEKQNKSQPDSNEVDPAAVDSLMNELRKKNDG